MSVLVTILASVAVLFFRSTFIRLQLIIFIYPILVMLLLMFGIEMPGIISAVGLSFYEPLLKVAFWWACGGYFLIVSVIWKYRGKKISYFVINIREKSRLVIVLANLVVAAVFLPKAFFLSSTTRFDLIPIFAWGALYNITSVVLLLSHRSFKKPSSMLHLLIIIFILLRGERADTLMLLICLFMFEGTHFRVERVLHAKAIALGGVTIVIMSAIGVIRIVGWEYFKEYWTHYLGLSFYAQQTAVDVTHVYLSSVWYYFNEEFALETWFNLPLSIVPGLPGGGTGAPYNYSQFLKEWIPNVNGGLFYSEATINLGLLGVLLYCFCFGLILRSFLVTSHMNLAKGVLFGLFYIMCFRFQWYGVLFVLKPFMVAFFLLYLGIRSTRKFYESGNSA